LPLHAAVLNAAFNLSTISPHSLLAEEKGWKAGGQKAFVTISSFASADYAAWGNGLGSNRL